LLAAEAEPETGLGTTTDERVDGLGVITADADETGLTEDGATGVVLTDDGATGVDLTEETITGVDLTEDGATGVDLTDEATDGALGLTDETGVETGLMELSGAEADELTLAVLVALVGRVKVGRVKGSEIDGKVIVRTPGMVKGSASASATGAALTMLAVARRAITDDLNNMVEKVA